MTAEYALGVRSRHVLTALTLDVVCVLVFCALGRRSHAEGVTVSGVAQTAWPFLVGAAVGWLLSRGWMSQEQKVHRLEVSAHEDSHTANILPTAKQSTYSRLVLIVISLKLWFLPIEARGKPFAKLSVVLSEISDKE